MQMTAKRWQRVKTIYQQAAETAPEKRRSFLRESCGADTDLRAEVEELLGFHAVSEEVFEEPIFEVSVKLLTEDKILPVGERIDNYRTVREIGRGGMGVVFLAERVDGLFEKKVALERI